MSWAEAMNRHYVINNWRQQAPPPRLSQSEREREKEKLERNIALVFAYSNVLNRKESGTLALVFKIVFLIFG